MEIDGVQAREVLGDWSFLPEWDRPPKYIVEGQSAQTLSPYDRSEDRLPVKQRHPGKTLTFLKNIHQGKVAILFNGASLADHDLYSISCPIIGMNRTYKGYKGYEGPDPDYLCVVDHSWLDVPEVRAHPGLINGSTRNDDLGYRATRNCRMSPFSFDLVRDGYVCPVPGTTGHLALQVAVHLGFSDLYCIGLDLGGKHFDGSNASLAFIHMIRYHSRQRPLLETHGINVYVCGSPNSNAPFEHRPFEELCAQPTPIDVYFQAARGA